MGGAYAKWADVKAKARALDSRSEADRAVAGAVAGQPGRGVGFGVGRHRAAYRRRRAEAAGRGHAAAGLQVRGDLTALRAAYGRRRRAVGQ